MKFNNYYRRPVTVGEVNNEPSKTVPDQAMTIDEIISRTQRGLPVTGVKVPMYNETDDGILPDLRKLDISEFHELKKRMYKAEKEIRKQLKEEEDKRKQEETEAYYKKKFATPEPVEPKQPTTPPES